MINNRAGFPRWVKLAVGSLIVIAFVALFLSSILEKTEIMDQVEGFAIIITLSVLICYCYSTYLLAKEAWTISASWSLVQIENSPYKFCLFFHNFSKFHVKCYCNLNASIYGKPIETGGFFSGKSAVDIQPYSSANTAFHSLDIFLEKDNRKIKQMIEDAKDQNRKDQLYLNIDFWYHRSGSNDVVHSPKQPKFFDFRREIWVSDF